MAALQTGGYFDRDFRFFPTIADESGGQIPHPIDVAIDKAIAAAGRRDLRNLVELLAIHATFLPLGAAILAAAVKMPGFTPEGLVARIRRNSNYSRAEWSELVTSEPVDPVATMVRLRAALAEAEAFVIRIPTDKVGLLFLKDGEVVQPDPDRLDEYQTHAGGSSEISSSMLERYRKPPAS